MRVLVAGEFSQIICQAFIRRGHDAWSCDLENTEGDPKRHLRIDWREATQDSWDLLIAHPVCKKLSNCGNKWYKNGYWTTPSEVKKRKEEREIAIEDFLFFKSKAVKHIPYRAIENPQPSGYVMKYIGRYDQKVQPWQFGDMETKGVCWWLHGLPLLKETNNVYEAMMNLPYRERARVHSCPPGPMRERDRSRFFPGMADATADQWGGMK